MYQFICVSVKPNNNSISEGTIVTSLDGANNCPYDTVLCNDAVGVQIELRRCGSINQYTDDYNNAWIWLPHAGKTIEVDRDYA